MKPSTESKGRLLVVDDDRLVLATLVHGLSQAGFEVVDADNGDDAILQARQHKPDLALLDIRMDGMSGFDVAAYLREHLHLPFMFLSAFSDDATVAQIAARLPVWYRQAVNAPAFLLLPLVMHHAWEDLVEVSLQRGRGQAEIGHAAGVEEHQLGDGVHFFEL